MMNKHQLHRRFSDVGRIRMVDFVPIQVSAFDASDDALESYASDFAEPETAARLREFASARRKLQGHWGKRNQRTASAERHLWD